jgi:hypothetical protein
MNLLQVRDHYCAGVSACVFVSLCDCVLHVRYFCVCVCVCVWCVCVCVFLSCICLSLSLLLCVCMCVCLCVCNVCVCVCVCVCMFSYVSMHTYACFSACPCFFSGEFSVECTQMYRIYALYEWKTSHHTYIRKQPSTQIPMIRTFAH